MITLDIPQNEVVIIEQASQMTGMSLDEFIYKNAYQNALAVIESGQGIYLTSDEWDRAIANLNNPPKPNLAMQELLKRGQELYGNAF